MRLLKQRDNVTVAIWFTYVKGYDFGEGDEPIPFTDVIIARVGIAAAQNYLRHCRNDSRLVVTDAECERTKWVCDIETFLSVARNIEGKTLDTKEI